MMQHKEPLFVFGFRDYYPSGGARDFLGIRNDLDSAKSLAHYHLNSPESNGLNILTDTYQICIVENDKLRIIFDGEAQRVSTAQQLFILWEKH